MSSAEVNNALSWTATVPHVFTVMY